jgi:hypothetical protein
LEGIYPAGKAKRGSLENMKRLLLISLILCLTGCVSVRIPKYLQDKHPYQRKFYASYEETLEAASRTLTQLGWHISGTADPALYEQNQAKDDGGAKSILIFTEIRESSWILFSRYSQLNCYVRTTDAATEVELRYTNILALPFKNFQSYRNDRYIEKVFQQIERWLKEKSQ